MAESGGIRVAVDVVLAEAGRHRSVSLSLPAGTTAWGAVEASKLLEGRSNLDPAHLAVAIYGRQVPRERELEAGDRVEILRPLADDPKVRRRRAAQEGKVIGRG